MKKKLALLFFGFFAGVLFALFDTATNNLDVAPIDSDFGFLFSELIENFDILRVVLYGLIGLIIIAVLFSILKIVKISSKTWK